MARNLRNHIVRINSLSLNNDGSVTGSGPSYTVEYDTGEDISNAQVGNFVYVEKRVAGAGASSTVQSTYVYVVTAVGSGGPDPDDLGGGGGQSQLTIKYVYDTAGTGDDSPADLPRGDGSSGSPNKANHKVVMVLGEAFNVFL